MNITIVTAGSRGDVQPYIALGTGLKADGHQVRVLATDDFEALVTGAGLAFYSSGVSVQEIMQGEQWRERVESGNFLAIQMQMRRELQTYAAGMVQPLMDASADADLIIGGFGVLAGGYSVGEKLGIPVMQAHVIPGEPTNVYPSPITPSLPFGAVLNRPSFVISKQILWHSMRTADVVVREQLGLPAGSFWGPYRSLEQQGVPSLHGYSRHVLPKPSDWGDEHHITGYWFLDADDDWSPPNDLLAFLDAGPPPVYIGFGSMRSGDPAETGRLTLDALARSGQRGILSRGWGGLAPDDLPETVHMIGSTPHTWLFPRMAAVVHHGGAGTTAAGLRAGVPSVIVPFMGDQPFWGKRVVELGVGPSPIPRKTLTADRLAAAITQAVTDGAMQARAADLGANIRDEDGLANAAALVRAAMGERVA